MGVKGPHEGENNEEELEKCHRENNDHKVDGRGVSLFADFAPEMFEDEVGTAERGLSYSWRICLSFGHAGQIQVSGELWEPD